MTLTFYEYHILEAHIVVLCEILVAMHCNCMELRIKLLMTKSSFEIMKDSKSFCTFSQLNELRSASGESWTLDLSILLHFEKNADSGAED